MKGLLAPYPKAEIGLEVILKWFAALNGIIDDYSYLHCTELGCGCTSSKKVAFAVSTMKEMEKFVEDNS